MMKLETNDKVKNSLSLVDGTLSSSGLSILSLLPLLMASPTNYSQSTSLRDFSNSSYGFELSGSSIMIENTRSQSSGDSFTLNSISSVEYKQLEIMESFIGKILDNSERLPDVISKSIFDNIDSLLIDG